LQVETPRDRQASFDPKIVAKKQTRWTGFDDNIISMYARGMNDARDPGPSAGDVQDRGFSQPDLQRNRVFVSRSVGLLVMKAY
jgi:hypothetical protein